MSGVQGQRVTHAGDDGVVVFLVGMTVNRPWRPGAYLPVFAAMPRMLAELHRERERGFLGHEVLVGRRGPTVLTYWRSARALHDYASDPTGQHRPAWTAFNARARRGAAAGAVGIWHETYDVPAHGVESIYVGAPALGLVRAVGGQPLSRRGEAFRERLGSAT